VGTSFFFVSSKNKIVILFVFLGYPAVK